MLRQATPYFIGALLIAGTGLFAGCGQSLESNPTFQENVARVEKIEESVNDTKNRLVMLNNEFQTVSKDVNTLLTAGPGGSDAAVKALETRVATLENTLKGLNENLVALNGKLDARPARSVASRNADADVAEANAPDSGMDAGAADKPAKSSKTSRKVRGTTAVATRHAGRSAEAESVAEVARVTGQYHLVQQGETIEKIASRYRTSPKQILNANRIPTGRRLLPGQQIYVPNS
jgi:LysM repeat protein